MGLTCHRASLQQHLPSLPPRELYGLVTLPFMLIAYVTERDPGTDTKAHPRRDIWLFFSGRSKLNRWEHVRFLEESNSGQHSVHLPQQPGTSLWRCCCWEVNCCYCHIVDRRIIVVTVSVDRRTIVVTVTPLTVELLLLLSHCWHYNYCYCHTVGSRTIVVTVTLLAVELSLLLSNCWQWNYCSYCHSVGSRTIVVTVTVLAVELLLSHCWQWNCCYCHSVDSRIIVVTVTLLTVELLLLLLHCW